MEVSKRVITTAVITTTGTVHFLTDLENRNAMQAGLDDLIAVGDSLIKASIIAEIMPIKEYYQKHPETKPKEYVNLSDVAKEQGWEEKPIGFTGVIDNAKSKKAIEQMMIGFLRSGKREHPLYKHMEEKLKQYDQQ